MESSDSDIDNDVPDTGAAFTFGKCKDQYDFEPEKFYFKMDAIKQVCCGDRYTAILTQSHKVYSFGANEYGQLGHGHNRPVGQPKKIKALRNEPVSLVACGRCHTIVYTASGRMYSCGMNTEGQLGIGRSSNDVTDYKFHLIPSLSVPQQTKILKIDCGGDHALALTSEGAVFSWGENDRGQLGLGDNNSRNKPCRVTLVRESVRDISCGYYHSALVTSTGKLWMFGEGESGQLGLSSIRTTQKESPECVLKFTEPVELVSCGMSHTAVITKSGQLYTFGTGKFGQLGHGPLCMRSNLPKPVEALRNLKITQVSCGENHTAALSEKGQLIMFGDGKDGKLCQVGDEFANVFNPVPVLRFKKFKVLSFSLGACHSVVVATKKNDSSSFDDSDEEEEGGVVGDSDQIGMYKFDYLGGTSMLRMANMRKSATLPARGVSGGKLSARDRRRARCIEKDRERLSQTLPIHWTQKLGSLPDLSFDAPKGDASLTKRSSDEKDPGSPGKKAKTTTAVSSVDEVDSTKPLEGEILEEPLEIGSKGKNVALHASAPNLTSITVEKEAEKKSSAPTDGDGDTTTEYEYEYGSTGEINESLDTTNLSEKESGEEDEDKDSGKKKKFLGIFSRKKHSEDADTSFNSEKDSEKSSKSDKKGKDSSNDSESKAKGVKGEKEKSKDKKRISWADEEANGSEDDDAESNDGGKSPKKGKKDKEKEKEKKKKEKEASKSKKDKKADKNDENDSDEEANSEAKKEEKKSGGGFLSKLRKKKETEVEEFDPNDVPSDTDDEEGVDKKDKKSKDKGKGKDKSKDKETEEKNKDNADEKDVAEKEDEENSEKDKKGKDKDKDKESKKEKEKLEKERKEKEKLEKEKEKEEEKKRKEKEKERKEKEKQEKKDKDKKDKDKEKKSGKGSKGSKEDKKKKDEADDDEDGDEYGSQVGEELEDMSEEEEESVKEDDKSKNKKEKTKKKVTINESSEDLTAEGSKKKGLFGRFGK